jgi:nicotinate phosphoribosyltransferase
MEFGARRAHNFDSALYGARAAYIAGAAGTATVEAGHSFGIPALGTMAHSFIQSFPDEYEAFKAYAKTYPDSCTLLIDTYNTIKSGLENAIRVAKEELEPNGFRLKGVRIDSGDMAYLSKKIRNRLDAEGMQDCSIVVSNSLDEYLIESLVDRQGAKIDSFGVGENMIVSRNSPVFGGVYKLSSIEENGVMEPCIKISENEEKITNPGWKKLYRIYNKEDGKAMADIMILQDENISEEEDVTVFHPMKSWKSKTFEKGTFELRELLVPVFIDGKLVYKSPSLEGIRDYCHREQETLWEEIKRFSNPQEYYVDLSEKLLNLKLNMIQERR